jgi:hypothetical protein
MSETLFFLCFVVSLFIPDFLCHINKINQIFKFNFKINIINNNTYLTKGFNFKFINDNSSFIQNDNINIDKIDISTKNESYPNIIKTNDNEIIYLTKTKNFQNKVKYYTFNKNDYLLFSQIKHNSTISTFISSTNPKLINKSQHLIFDDYKTLFLTTITTFFPLFIFGQIYSILFLIPILIIVFPIFLFKITWAEQNQNKLLIFSIVLYLLTKIKYVFFNITLTDLPIIFTNHILRSIIALLLTLISIYCMIDFSKKDNSNIFKSFLMFFIIDMITFTLFFTPYFLL